MYYFIDRTQKAFPMQCPGSQSSRGFFAIPDILRPSSSPPQSRAYIGTYVLRSCNRAKNCQTLSLCCCCCCCFYSSSSSFLLIFRHGGRCTETAPRGGRPAPAPAPAAAALLLLPQRPSHWLPRGRGRGHGRVGRRQRSAAALLLAAADRRRRRRRRRRGGSRCGLLSLLPPSPGPGQVRAFAPASPGPLSPARLRTHRGIFASPGPQPQPQPQPQPSSSFSSSFSSSSFSATRLSAGLRQYEAPDGSTLSYRYRPGSHRARKKRKQQEKEAEAEADARPRHGSRRLRSHGHFLVLRRPSSPSPSSARSSPSSHPSHWTGPVLLVLGGVHQLLRRSGGASGSGPARDWPRERRHPVRSLLGP